MNIGDEFETVSGIGTCISNINDLLISIHLSTNQLNGQEGDIDILLSYKSAPTKLLCFLPLSVLVDGTKKGIYSSCGVINWSSEQCEILDTQIWTLLMTKYNICPNEFVM